MNFTNNPYFSLMFFIIILILSVILSKIFIALAIYNDAKSRDNENAIAWGILSFLFDIIALIFYAVLRKGKKPISCCNYCKLKVYNKVKNCERCGHKIIYSESPINYHKQLKKRKIFTVLFIITFVFSIFLYFISDNLNIYGQYHFMKLTQIILIKTVLVVQPHRAHQATRLVPIHMISQFQLQAVTHSSKRIMNFSCINIK